MPGPRLLVAFGALVLSLSTPGCASLATRKNLSVLLPGSTREAVVYELGQPVTSTERDGHAVDVFRFVQGKRKSRKAPRPVEADQEQSAEIYALFEHVGGKPLAALTGKEFTVQVNYGADERIERVVLLRIQ